MVMFGGEIIEGFKIEVKAGEFFMEYILFIVRVRQHLIIIEGKDKCE